MSITCCQLEVAPTQTDANSNATKLSIWPTHKGVTTMQTLTSICQTASSSFRPAGKHKRGLTVNNKSRCVGSDWPQVISQRLSPSFPK